jgi:hypothetical protein
LIVAIAVAGVALFVLPPSVFLQFLIYSRSGSFIDRGSVKKKITAKNLLPAPYVF